MLVSTRHLCAVFLLCASTFSASALVFNRAVILDTRLSISIQNAQVVVGERLFYVDRDNVLHVSDGTRAGSFPLLDNVGLRFGEVNTSIAVLDGIVYVTRANVSDNGFLFDFELWQTDGTLANTRRSLDVELPDFQTSQGIRVINDRLFILGASDNPSDPNFENRDLIVSDGTQSGTLIIPGIGPRLETLCMPEIDRFYYFDFESSLFADDSVIRFFNGTSVEDVSLENGSRAFAFSPPEQIGQQCIYTTLQRPDRTFQQLVSLDVDGEQITYTLPITNSTGTSQDQLVLSTEFQDALLVSRAVPGGSTSRRGFFFRLFPGDPELMPVTLDVFGSTDPLDAFTVESIASSIENLYIQLRPQQTDPPVSFPLFILDNDLMIVGVENRSGLNDAELFSFNGEDFIADESQLIRTISPDTIRHFDFDFQRLIFNRGEDNAAIYAVATDRQTNLSALYRLDDVPTVSERLQGLWGNDAFNRTGVQINTAIGADGRTRFLFIALLAHSESEPVWIGGAAPIVDGANQISMTMRLTTGLNFLVPDANLTGQQTELGTATLTVLGCDRINIEFDLIQPFGFHDVPLDRVVDTTFAPLCVD